MSQEEIINTVEGVGDGVDRVSEAMEVCEEEKVKKDVVVEAEKPSSAPPSVGFSELFRFSDGLDYILMTIGAIIHGCSLPLFLWFFADLVVVSYLQFATMDGVLIFTELVKQLQDLSTGWLYCDPDIKDIIKIAHTDEVESVVLKKYGELAYRIFRFLSKTGRLSESDKIAADTLGDKKEVLKILYSLWKDGYLQMKCCGCNVFHKLVDNLNLFHEMKCYVPSSFNYNEGKDV